MVCFHKPAIKAHNRRNECPSVCIPTSNFYSKFTSAQNKTSEGTNFRLKVKKNSFFKKKQQQKKSHSEYNYYILGTFPLPVFQLGGILASY